MKHLLRLSVVSLVALACADAPTATRALLPNGPSLAATTTTTNEFIPVAIGVFIPCANGGAGENVVLTGELHILSHVTISNSGNVSLKIHFQPQGISGDGQVTGDKYQGTGVTQEHVNINNPLPFVDTFVNNFRMIGQGPGNNFSVHQNVHVTVNANGDVTSTVNNNNVSCS